MTALQANCPACGADVTFKSGSSVVVVCEYCKSVVARTDRALEDLGKVAEIVESGSPLDVGLAGVYRGVAFELTGRAQLEHAAGGMWDEWYAAFADGRWGWLAEAQGRFFLTYPTPSPIEVPPFDALEPGRGISGIPVAVPLVVMEKGEARMLAARGEIPYRLVPGEVYPYADLSGQGGVFGTIDYGEEPPLVYIGREITLAELGIAETARAAEHEARRVTAAQLQCPQCAGPLELRAPDKTERVTCPNCGSLLDVNQGNLRFLEALEPGKFTPTIPIGVTGEFKGGQKLTVIGFMVRSVEFEGTRYFWEEYLLYDPPVGFRWLVQSDNHWSFVEPVAPGEVTDGDKIVRFRGKSFKIFQDALARVEHVAGEFYWKVTTGELVRAADFINAPEMLSKEVSGTELIGQRKRKKHRLHQEQQQEEQNHLEAEEINWSLGTYMSRRDVERAFGITGLPVALTVAPNQPFFHSKIYGYWGLLLVITLAVGMLTIVTGARRKIFEQTFSLQLPAPSPPATPQTLLPITGANSALPNAPRSRARATPTPRTSPTPRAAATTVRESEGTQVIFTEPFEVRGRQNIRVTARSNVDNNWLFVAGDLINEETGVVQQFEIPLEYYYGVEDGESWKEGDRDKSTYLSALPGGTYTMRLEAQWEGRRAGVPRFSILLEQGVPRFLNLFLALLALSAVPVLVLIYHIMFEHRRWADSAFNPYATATEGDDSTESDE